MDLVQTIHKGGKSRGGAGNFSWDAVKDDKHRENYLGHSLKAPVGRWQRGKDLSWYAKQGDGEDGDGKIMTEEEMRMEEIRRVKEAETAALNAALGITAPAGTTATSVMGSGNGSVNPNLQALGSVNRMDRGGGTEEKGRRHQHRTGRSDRDRDRRRDRSRSRSRSRDRHREHKTRRRDRSRSASRERHRIRRDRDPDGDRDRGRSSDGARDRERDRSRSVERRRDEKHHTSRREGSRERRDGNIPRDRSRDRRRERSKPRSRGRD